MFINVTVEIEAPDGEIHVVDAEGRFYLGSLEDWWIDTDIQVSTNTADYIVQKLYDEYVLAA